MTHYRDERNHQGLENRLLRPLGAVGEPHARVNGVSDSAECSAIIIARQLDQLRFCFWTLRSLVSNHSRSLVQHGTRKAIDM